MPGAYAVFLLLSIGGLATLDYRYTLALWYNARQTLIVLGNALAFFIVWDIAGILAGIFRIGQNTLLIGLHIGEFPIEELLFLVLLNYTSLIVYCGLRRRRLS